MLLYYCLYLWVVDGVYGLVHGPLWLFIVCNLYVSPCGLVVCCAVLCVVVVCVLLLYVGMLLFILCCVSFRVCFFVSGLFAACA